MHIEALGRKARVNPGKLGRVMRLLATRHIFKEGTDSRHPFQSHINIKHLCIPVSTDCFANNRLSLQLLSSNPLTNIISHLLALIYFPTSAKQTLITRQYSADENNKATAMLTEVLADPDWAYSTTFERSPWNRSTGFNGSLYQYYEGVCLLWRLLPCPHG